MPRLPNELYREVVQNVSDRRDLYSLLLTSRLLNYETERILLREIRMVGSCPPAGRLGQANVLANHLFERIQSCHELGAKVRTLHYFPEVICPDLFDDVLPRLKQLTHLTCQSKIHPLFLQCEFTLQSFTCSSLGHVDYLALHQFHQFLVAQGSVTELLVSGWKASMLLAGHRHCLAPNSLPNLTTLRFYDGAWVGRVLRGRRVTRLFVECGFTSDTGDRGEDTDLQRIRVLVSMRIPLDCSSLRNLQYLVTELPPLAKKLMKSVESLTTLKQLCIVGCNPTDPLQEAKGFFAANHSLQSVRFISNGLSLFNNLQTEPFDTTIVSRSGHLVGQKWNADEWVTYTVEE